MSSSLTKRGPRAKPDKLRLGGIELEPARRTPFLQVTDAGQDERRWRQWWSLLGVYTQYIDRIYDSFSEYGVFSGLVINSAAGAVYRMTRLLTLRWWQIVWSLRSCTTSTCTAWSQHESGDITLATFTHDELTSSVSMCAGSQSDCGCDLNPDLDPVQSKNF